MDIPEDLDAFRRYNQDYEAAHFQFAETNNTVGAATSELLLGFYLPRGLLWLGRPAIRAFMDAPLLAAMGFPAAPRWLRSALMSVMAMRARVLRMLPARRRPRFLTQVHRPTYPEGYAIEDLGTFGRSDRAD